MKKTLKVRAVPGHLQPNFEAFDARVRRFVGMRYDPSLGHDLIFTAGPRKGQSAGKTGGFVLLEQGEEIPYRGEYVQALKDGVLAPMDYETASLCGITFDTYQI